MTDELSDSLVEVGQSSSFDGSVHVPDLVLQHSVTLTGLLPSTYYYFRVTSTDASGNQRISPIFVFLTRSVPDTTPPSVVILSPAPGSNLSGVVAVSGTANDNKGMANVAYKLDSGTYSVANGTGPWSFMLDTLGVSDGTHQLWVRATDLSSNQTETMISVQTDNSGNAPYDPIHKTAACTIVGSYCSPGVGFRGRGNSMVPPEPHAPNTIFNSCYDGENANFHILESLDLLTIRSKDGGPLTAGKSAIVEATVWAAAGGSPSNFLDLYYTQYADAPVWKLLGTTTVTANGFVKLSTEYVLPSGSLQAIRGSYRYGSGEGPCVTGLYNDRDDLVFAVDPGLTSESLPLNPSPQFGGGTLAPAASASIDGIGVHYAYPNPLPAGHVPTFHLETGFVPEQAHLEVLDGAGLIVHEAELYSKGGASSGSVVSEYQWTNAELASGVYRYRIRVKGQGRESRLQGHLAVLK